MPTSSASFCPKCAREVRDSWRVCPACLAPLDGATQTIFQQSSSSSASIDEGRFPAGTVLAGRYRVLGLLGQGGMGEVYRAFDLILNQAVALKFLAGPKISEPALARFRNEVRIARQVSHPNVCRVYDIGMVEGLHFISMEYLDGEDLDSLIRRIGRIPQDKGIEFARKICGGLAAAHDRGVLHRDLKPANIMIDGRGQVRITDFGLAALAAEIPLSDFRSGTPAYMSPEQKAGKDVTIRSDLYSLGLVLYEMFTGKRRSGTQTNPTEIVKDLDPAVERVILRCLEDDPKRRPQSALSVAMALPGGDPVAAALAAGETPSPEMVAASQEKQGFSPRTALVCFTAILAALAVVAGTRAKSDLLSHAPLPTPPDGLAYRAQEILKQFGYAEPARTAAYGFHVPDTSFLKFAEQQNRARRDVLLATHQPAIVRFWYREHQVEFRPDSFALDTPAGLCCMVLFDSPPNLEPGMARLELDANGRLVSLEVRPPARSSTAESVKPPDWAALFNAAGLNPARFTPAVPEETPPMAADTRAAWTGTYTPDRPERLHVEAASWSGRPVYFRITGNWQADSPTGTSVAAGLQIFAVCLLILILCGGVLLASHNLRLGRGDRAGAARLGVTAFVLILVAWLLSARHVLGFWELNLFAIAVSWGAFAAGTLSCLYLAIEPYIRRHWPDALISWTRLQAGRFRDPLVASHILAGLVFSQVFGALVNPLFSLAGSRLRIPLNFIVLDGSRHFAAVLLGESVLALFGAFGFLFLLAGARTLLRRTRLADALLCFLFVLLQLGNPTLPDLWQRAVTAAILAPFLYGFLWMVRQFGLLSLVVGLSHGLYFATKPFSLGSWFADRSLALILIPAITSAFAVWVILSSDRRKTPDIAA